MLGGPVRDRIRLYWSHCGTYRLAWAEAMQIPPLRTLQDVVNAGKEVRERGYTALKTNVFVLGADPHLHSPGFARRGSFPELNADRHVLGALRDELAAFREGTGPDVDILLDLNFNFKTEGFLKVARAAEPFDLFWIEIDTRDAKALRYIRDHASIPVASCECLFGRRDYRPYFEHASVDVAIIDTPWNGVAESIKIAAMADAYEINVAPHNFYGHLATMMNAHFCAVVPNLRIMEIDPDVVPWYGDLVTVTPDIRDGHLHLPTGPGWGTEVNEEAVRAHPPRRR
jgi:L-alanine-DL-glutamate epimerase-like enolase superfamily enzyme